jgi:hypothetical protein
MHGGQSCRLRCHSGDPRSRRCCGYLVCPETPLNSPDYQTRKTSLVSQGDNWIDVHGAAGGDVACDESDGGEQKRRADESKWVE